jgi:GNAT superfamily N-acetyltransferase
MRADDVIEALEVLDRAGVRYWVGGGWGVVALAGRQTREHRDLDLAVDAEDLCACLAVLGDLGYQAETDWRPVRIELAAAGARWVDVHPVTFGEDGHGHQAGLGGEHFDYMPSSFTAGSLAGRRVNCLSAEQQRQFRTGYDLRPQDLHDLAELDTVQELSRISVDDPGAADVRELLERHLEFANEHSPLEDVHALDVSALLDPAVTFFSYRRRGKLLAVGALRHIDADHAELKSMHTALAARGRGIGRAMVEHLLSVARDHGFRRVSLETGSMPAFAPARALYARAGFCPCGPFGDYPPSRNSTFMTLALDSPAPQRGQGPREC